MKKKTDTEALPIDEADKLYQQVQDALSRHLDAMRVLRESIKEIGNRDEDRIPELQDRSRIVR